MVQKLRCTKLPLDAIVHPFVCQNLAVSGVMCSPDLRSRSTLQCFVFSKRQKLSCLLAALGVPKILATAETPNLEGNDNVKHD